MRNMIRATLIISALASARRRLRARKCGDRKYVHRHWTADRSGPARGIRSGGWTQQPAAATNNSRPTTNLSPSQKNAMPPPNVRGYQR